MKLYGKIAESKGKMLLRESFQFAFDDIHLVQLPESTLAESRGTSYQSFAVLGNVPVTKFTENLNGRIYPKQLWERIFRTKLAEGSLCLADHAEGEGSTTRICGIWHNFRITDQAGFADLFLVGPYGKLLYDVVRAGGNAGMSTVGYGELEEDGKTVVWDSFELSERLADWVVAPSQEVFATDQNIVPKIESIQVESTNKKEEHTETSMDQVFTKIQESNIKNQINGIKRRLKKEPQSIIEAVEQVKDLLEVTPNSFLVRERVEKFYEELTCQLDAYIEKREHEFTQNQETNQKLKGDFDALTGVVKALEEENLKMKEVFDRLGDSEKSNLVEELEGQVSELSNKQALMLSDIKKFQENDLLMKKDMELLVKERAEIIKENDLLRRDRKLMNHDLQEFEKLEHTLRDENSMLEIKLAEVMDSPDKRPSWEENRVENDLPQESKKKNESHHEDQLCSETTNRYDRKKLGRALISYYESEIRKNPSIADIEDQILDSSSLLEALKKVECFTQKNSEYPIKLTSEFKESLEKEESAGWLGNRY